MSGFRSRLLPALFTIAVVLVCAGLGLWQLERLEWKRGLIAQREAAAAAPPVALPATLPDPQRLEYRRVFVSGVFLHDKEVHLHALGPEGTLGFDLLTPLRAEGGWIVFVNRGFVPDWERAEQAAGTVWVTGRLRLPPATKPNRFVPDNPHDRGDLWFWIELPAMAAAGGLADAAPFYVDADATPNPGGWPKGGVTPIALPNDHLQYAITWFSLAVIAIVIYLLSQRGGARKKTSDDEGLPGT